MCRLPLPRRSSSRREGKEPSVETICIRCYDEGFAVRTKFVIGTYHVGAIEGERTNWRFADGAAAWGITATEGTFPADPIPVANMSGSGWRMPLTLCVPGGIYASVFEAHVENYPRSYILLPPLSALFRTILIGLTAVAKAFRITGSHTALLILRIP